MLKKKSSEENKSSFAAASGGLNAGAVPFKPTWTASITTPSLTPINPEEGEITEEKTVTNAPSSFFVHSKLPTPQGSPRGGLSTLAKPTSSIFGSGFTPESSLFRKTPTQQIELAASTSTAAITGVSSSDNLSTNYSEAVAEKTEDDLLQENNTDLLEDGEIAPTAVTTAAPKVAATPSVRGGRGAGRGRGGRLGSVAAPLSPATATAATTAATATAATIAATTTSVQESPASTAAAPKHVSQMTTEERKAYQQKLMNERKARFEKEKADKESEGK